MPLKRVLSYAVCLGFVCAPVGGLWAQNLVREVVLHNFANPNPPNGAQSVAPLLRDSAGNLYGTTTKGGVNNAGVVFKVDASGVVTVLYTFTGGSDGYMPTSGLIADPAGNLYGTTNWGGLGGCGVVYRLNASGETVLHSFDCRSGGEYPAAGVIADLAGNLYGTTSFGGTYNSGVVYKLNASGETVLYNFTGGSDGGFPRSGVIWDAAGDLYGTTASGGNFGSTPGGSGVVYRLDPSGTETVLYAFTGGNDGGNPLDGVIRDPAGNLYGVAQGSGNSPSYGGVVYKLSPSGQETTLHVFTGGSDGSSPRGGVIGDAAGNLYGTTRFGGEGNAGVAYKLSPAGETILYSFSGAFQDANASGGVYPAAGLIRDAEGNLYGNTPAGNPNGGFSGPGVVFRIDPAGNETALAGLYGPADGVNPAGALARDAAGNIYGATSGGGKFLEGIVFKLDAAGRETALHAFTGGSDGGQPGGGVTIDPAGNLYGTASQGGANGQGVVWKIDTGGNWTVLYSFTGLADGGRPQAGVILDAVGNLYGTTSSSAFGAVYKLDPAGLETTLYTFTGGADGGNPQAGVIRDSSGSLYGTTKLGGLGKGVVYKVDPTGRETVLYAFTGGDDGANPVAGLMRDSLGNLYGTTSGGGAAWPSPGGMVFMVDPSGHATALYTFSGGVDGSSPQSGLTPDLAGNVYGTALQGGTHKAGVVYRLSAAGEVVLYYFSGGTDGAKPGGGLIFDVAGNWYGTTTAGGLGTGGVVFKLAR